MTARMSAFLKFQILEADVKDAALLGGVFACSCGLIVSGVFVTGSGAGAVGALGTSFIFCT